MIPGNPAKKIVASVYAMRVMVMSHPKCSAMPAQTPASFLLEDLLSCIVFYVLNDRICVVCYYLTLNLCPMRMMDVDFMPLSRHRVETDVPYLRANAPNVSPLLTV